MVLRVSHMSGWVTRWSTVGLGQQMISVAESRDCCQAFSLLPGLRFEREWVRVNENESESDIERQRERERKKPLCFHHLSPARAKKKKTQKTKGFCCVLCVGFDRILVIYSSRWTQHRWTGLKQSILDNHKKVRSGLGAAWSFNREFYKLNII